MMERLISFLVQPGFIKWHTYSIDAFDGFMNFKPAVVDELTHVTMKAVKYKDLSIGDVFVVIDPDGVYSCDEPSCFLMKQSIGQWYLTGDWETPLGIDYDKYDDVWLVI